MQKADVRYCFLSLSLLFPSRLLFSCFFCLLVSLVVPYRESSFPRKAFLASSESQDAQKKPRRRTAKTCQPVIVPRCNCPQFSRTGPVYPYSSAQPSLFAFPGESENSCPPFTFDRELSFFRATQSTFLFSLSKIHRTVKINRRFTRQNIPLS